MCAEAQQEEDGDCNQDKFPLAQMQTHNICNYRCPLLICACSYAERQSHKHIWISAVRGLAYGSAEEVEES